MGTSTPRGASQPKAEAIRLGRPGMTTALSASMPATALLATSAAGTHITLGSDSAASASDIPAASAKPVSTGPGHRTVAVTPVGRSSARRAWP